MKLKITHIIKEEIIETTVDNAFIHESMGFINTLSAKGILHSRINLNTPHFIGFKVLEA